jgi:adenosylcobyric acid synthase
MSQPIFIGGTSSHSGKSWVATAICAWLHRQGIRVAPFKAQNMSNNSYPCRTGGEIGRAQVAQAWACGLEPEAAMNPILLKPNSEGGSQVVVNGKVWKNLTAREYYQHHDELFQVVVAAYEELASRFDVIVIEGAGSVSELNLRPFDLVNLRLVTHLSAPWLLVGDIERGGIFASIIGTIALLTPLERSLLRAFAVNKFRGDLSLFDQGRTILEQRTGFPCLGVLPYAHDIYVDAEDSLSISEGASSEDAHGSQCAIIRFPRISNTTDFRLLPNPKWIFKPVDEHFDFIFLPGTKNTISDLQWLRETKLDRWITAQHQRGSVLIGICGGFQMLGETIEDPLEVESGQMTAMGLGLLPVHTRMSADKTTRVVQATTPNGHKFSAYEIHMGDSKMEEDNYEPFANLETGLSDGVRRDRLIGTYLHGAFECAEILADLGIAVQTPATAREFSPLADWFEPFGHLFSKLFLEDILQP